MVGTLTRKFVVLVHFLGEEIELRYKLTNFGIPEALMPMTTTGKVKTDYQSNWVTILKAIEEQKKQRKQAIDGQSCQQREIVECPSSHDVVFRKGRPLYKRNPGNMYYRELIAAASFQHSEAARSGKYAITWNIVQEIESNGGRFLEWSSIGSGSGGMWVVMTDRKAIRDKIASALKQFNRDNLKKRDKAKAESKKKSQKGGQDQGAAPSTTGTRQQDQNKSKDIPSAIAAASQFPSNEVAINHPFGQKDLAFASGLNAHWGIDNVNDRRPYMFLQHDQQAQYGTTKRRRIGFACNNVAANCLPNNGYTIPPNNNIMYQQIQQIQSNNQRDKSKLNDAAGDDDSSIFGKMFFPTI